MLLDNLEHTDIYVCHEVAAHALPSILYVPPLSSTLVVVVVIAPLGLTRVF